MKKLLQKRNKKGFTLAELLIVIAIIAILVAVMFPVFGAQLNKARLAADLANVRAAYSEAVADAMLGGDTSLTGTVEDAQIKISYDKLEAAVKYNSTIKVTAATNTITVTSSAGSYNGSFVYDADVTIEGVPAETP